MLTKCEVCGETWLDARYDYGAVRWPERLAGRPSTLWRYEELLPLTDMSARITIGEGWTPIIRADRLGDALGHEHLLIKDERRNPTNSFKDRQGAVAVSVLKQYGVRECVLASTGNAAAAYAAYCARAGIKLWIFLTSMVPAEKMRELGLYGAEVVKVTGTYDQAKKVAADFAARRNLYFDRGARAVGGKESMKTLAFEIAEQLGLEFNDGKRWFAPDWYIQSVSGGIGPLGVLKGFQELHRMGMIDKVPKLGIVQAAGCAPMVQAYERGDRKATPVIPETLITVLATGDPGQAYVLLRDAIQKYGGAMVGVDDGQAFRAMRRLARTEGFSVEPATAVAFAGVEKMLALGYIGKDETVLINCSGHTFPAEKHILEDQYVLDLELGEAAPAQQVEGLGAALERLDEQIKTVVVIDDNPHDSRLVRRLLQAQKNYRVFEANSPVDGLDLVLQRKPDLVISDLMMPGIDGFSLLEQLKNNPETAHIPVMILSAKTLTAADKSKLEGRTESVWTKGNYKTRDLVEHVVQTLGDTGQADAKSPELSTAPATPVPASQEAADRLWRVLVVDDNPHDSRLVRRILEASKKFEVLEAYSGGSALRVMREQHPDMVILDMTLPDMGGLDVLETMRTSAELQGMKVAILSAKDLTEIDRNRLREAVFWQKATLDRRRLIESIEEQLALKN
jgi:threonine synthase